ncbi:MAG TPA: carbonic anhydrase [Psychromonas hadalis]|nr:carbonic anhydrase [Psychromonas hadalis]
MAIEKIQAGYTRFREGYYKENKEALLKLSTDGQFPKVAIISCSDSRVEPSIILDCEPGNLFVIRNVANLVPICEGNESYHGVSAALEYAVTVLEVEFIIVLGHTQCGGIRSLIDTPSLTKANTFISKWLRQLEDVRADILSDKRFTDIESRYSCCEVRGITQSLDHLMTFPWIEERVNSGKLSLHGWRYNLETAELCTVDSKTGELTKM